MFKVVQSNSSQFNHTHNGAGDHVLCTTATFLLVQRHYLSSFLMTKDSQAGVALLNGSVSYVK